MGAHLIPVGISGRSWGPDFIERTRLGWIFGDYRILKTACLDKWPLYKSWWPRYPLRHCSLVFYNFIVL